MDARCRLFVGSAGAVFLFVLAAYAQDSPSLGDVARQQRQQKGQSKTAQGKDVKASKVITNEELHQHPASAPALAAKGQENEASAPASSDGANRPTEDVKSEIEAQKSQIVSLQQQIEDINESIRFAPANCVANCVEWNEHQREKQLQVERMQAQLEEQKKRLEELQDSARKQGYGSSVYDP